MREAQHTLARTRVTQSEWATGDSLRLANIPIVEDNRSPASAAAAQVFWLPEEIFRQLFCAPFGGRQEVLTGRSKIVHLLHSLRGDSGDRSKTPIFCLCK